MNKSGLGNTIYLFFEDYLKCQKGVQYKTIQSYRDTLRLFLQFVSKVSHCSITKLSLSDMTSDCVSRFLKSLEENRNNKVQTRNQRLVALRTFFGYIARQDPQMLKEAQQVAALPTKRTSPPETFYLEHDEINLLFTNLADCTKNSLRDYILLLFLYNTGARVEEVAQLKVSNLELNGQLRVHLHGKGNKWRVCPIWKKTSDLLSRIIKENNCTDKHDCPVFLSRSGRALTRFGIYKIVRRHTAQFNKKTANGTNKYVSPHLIRHSTAVHLLESGVDVNVIRAWLGHVSLQTTNRYAEISLKMKAKALKICEPQLDVSTVHRKHPIWRDDSSLLKWLKSL